MTLKSLALKALCSILPALAIAQNADERPEIQIRRASGPISLDGSLDEAAWREAQMATSFKRNFPNDTALQTWQTEARLTFDDRNLYAAFVCYQRREDYVVQSYKRDFPGGSSDVINLMLDPFRDGLNGFLFSVSPLNVQREALLSNGADMALIWDNKWRSAVKNFGDRWVVELAVPFRTLRYKLAEGGAPNRWRANFLRTKLKDFEVGTWSPVPRAYAPQNIGFAGELLWIDPPPKPGANVSIIPYLTGRISSDFPRSASLERLPTAQDRAGGAGLDAKIGVTPSLNLDLTLNPDFSQVEVDRQVANLSRFELFFPETRQFFLENQDLFGMFGFPSTRPFFSRRIGLARNPKTGLNEKIPIIGGARLSGKLTDRTRIGLLNMTTDRRDWDSTLVLPAANFTALTLQQRTFARSALGFVFVDKENFLDKLNETQRAGHQPWNRVAGLEYNLYSKDNRWEGEWYYHRSFSPDAARRGQTFASYLGYNDRKAQLGLGYWNIGKGYAADAGFVPRNSVQGFFPFGALRFYPKNRGWLDQKTSLYELGCEGSATLALDGKFLDGSANPYFSVLFKQQGIARLGGYVSRTFLFEPFALNLPLESGEKPLPVGDYRYWGLQGEAATGTSHDWQGGAAFAFGGYYLGAYASVDATASYRAQPIGQFSISANWTAIRQPAPYPSGSFWLIGPKADVSFRRDLFLTAFFQYNLQANNFNANARLQWRFAPVSDVFLVYTENAFAQSVPGANIRFLTTKNRAIVLKAVYWFNA